MASSIASLVPEPMEKCAVALASAEQHDVVGSPLLATDGREVSPKRALVISLWPASSSANTPQERAEASSSSLSRPGAPEGFGIGLITQVERPADTDSSAQ